MDCILGRPYPYLKFYNPHLTHNHGRSLMDIHPTDLRRIDLNLLVSLDALLAE